jgi:hypothetical protein
MKISQDTAADILKTFIQEDRTEIRLIRDKIQNVTATLVLASFAITSFLIQDQDQDQGQGQGQTKSIVAYSWAVDALLILTIAVHYLRIRIDLLKLRKALKARQNILIGIINSEQQHINPFPNAQNIEPDIHDRDLHWYVGLAIALILIKSLVIKYAVFT